MIRRYFILFALAILTVCLAAGGPLPEGKVIAAYNRFGFEIFHQLLKKDAGRNVFISPPSLALALAMTCNGAEGATRDAMAKVLGLDGLDLREVNEANAALLSGWQNPDPKVEISIANSLWGSKGLEFNDDFLKRNHDYYQAEISTLDFDDPAAADRVNRWVNEKTNGKIDRIVDAASLRRAALVLLNAVYFNGGWRNVFEKSGTKPHPFTLPDGTVKPVPMMSRYGTYSYYEENNMQAISIPYGDGRFSFFIFLPPKDADFKTFLDGLSSGGWEKLVSQFSDTSGTIQLPRFSAKYEASMNGPLEALGMGIAFDKEADFRGMTSSRQRFFIDQVKQKTFLKVDEHGTEASAVTSVTIRPTAIFRPSKTFVMVVDHRFFCAIRDNKTGALLFIGAIADPE